jgi:hypothetical protein
LRHRGLFDGPTDRRPSVDLALDKPIDTSLSRRPARVGAAADTIPASMVPARTIGQGGV